MITRTIDIDLSDEGVLLCAAIASIMATSGKTQHEVLRDLNRLLLEGKRRGMAFDTDKIDLSDLKVHE